jgi:hypothetical protein
VYTNGIIGSTNEGVGIGISDTGGEVSKEDNEGGNSDNCSVIG